MTKQSLAFEIASGRSIDRRNDSKNMPIFKYKTKDYEGRYHKGEIESGSQSEAVSLLTRKKLVVLSIREKKLGERSFLEKLTSKVSFTEVVIMTRQLATMIESGLVLSESLDIIKDQIENPFFKSVLTDISNDVKGGLDFATSLEKHPDVFPPIYPKLVRAGQVSGKLDEILLELATSLEKERTFKSKVRGAMIYPIAVLVIMVLVMMIMVFFVMPKIIGLFKDSGQELPLPTQIVVGFTNFMLSYWWLVFSLVFAIILGFKKYIESPSGRFKVDSFVLKVPVLKKVVELVILTNFTRTFSLLMGSGISILEAIKIVSEVVGNLVYKQALEESYKGVERGLTFSSQLLAYPVFPKIIGQMTRTGEETGKLDEVMKRMADYFQAESDESLKNITTLIEPVVIVFLGVGVGFLVIAVILPIYQLTTNVK